MKKVKLKVGDNVEIIGNIPYQLKNASKPLLGKITNIDGACILVKPKYQRYECEFYANELEYFDYKDKFKYKNKKVNRLSKKWYVKNPDDNVIEYLNDKYHLGTIPFSDCGYGELNGKQIFVPSMFNKHWEITQEEFNVALKEIQKRRENV